MGHVPTSCLHEDREVFRCDGLGDVPGADAAVPAARAEVLPEAGDTVGDGGDVGHATGPLSAQPSAQGRPGQQVQPRPRQPTTVLSLLDRARY